MVKLLLRYGTQGLLVAAPWLAAEVLFDPPKFPEPPREDGETEDNRHSRLRQ